MKKWFFSKEKNMIAQKGITLTALVVTIFVMLILAGISIKLTLKDDSLIGNVLKVHESQKISAITNALEVLKASNKIRNSSTNGQMNKYYETPANVQLPSGDIITDKYRISTDLFYFEMNDNYEYKIEETADGDIKIAYQGKIDELEPRIYKSSFGHTKNSITANVEAKRANEYKFYIKTDKNATYGDPIVTKETGYYEFKELQQDTTYYIKVEIVNNVGKVEIEQEITTGVITAPQGEITYGNVEWNSNHKASVDISTKENFYIQYQILNSIEDHLSEDAWITESNIGTGINVNDLEHGNIIYMRLYDGYNVSKTYTTLLIEDKEPPVVTLAQSGKSTSKSVVVNATAIDYEYGLPLTPRYTFYIKEDDKFVLKQTGNSPTYSPTELKHNTKYAIKVEVNDKAGNTGAATLDVTTDEVTQATVEGAIVFGNVNWDSSSANIAITTNTSYQIQYQVNGTDDSEWKLGKSVTGLNANDTIYARLWDGTNGGKYASVTILRENSILTLSELSGTTIYPNSKTFNVKENKSNGNLSVKSSDETIATAKIDGTVVTLTPKNKPGKVTITVTSAQTYRYNEISKIYTLEVIGKQTIVANNNEVTYNGASHSIDNVSSNISGASVKYCDTENGTYTTTKPTYVEVGTYTIYWKIEAEGYETEKGSNTLTIKRADVTTATLNAETSISATSGSVVYGTTNKFKVKASVAGKFTVTSKNTGKVTILNGAETTADANKEYEVIYRGIGVSEDEIDLEVSFIPNDTNNYKTPANKIFKVTVIKQQVASVSNLAVGTDGNVTWTASSNATGYEISIDGTNYTSATSGINYLSTITATTGTRTVYVRAINSDTANYTTPSSAVSKAVTVYSVALTKGTGVSAVTGAGNYINGATVTLGATVNSGYTWSKWTQTSGGAQVSTTKAYSAKISGNWAYTANANEIPQPFKTLGTAIGVDHYGETVRFNSGNAITVLGTETILDDFRIFYADSSNVYLIYCTGYPTSVQSMTYGVAKDSNNLLIHAMASDYLHYVVSYLKNNSNYSMSDYDSSTVDNSYASWSNLKLALNNTGTLGKKVTAVQGSPNATMWAASWNAKYNATNGVVEKLRTIEFTISENMAKWNPGYHIKSNNNTTLRFSENLANIGTRGALIQSSRTISTPGGTVTIPAVYANGTGYYDALYFPETGKYWLASPSADWYEVDGGTYNEAAWVVNQNGLVDGGQSNIEGAARPVVCIPTSDFISLTGITLK